MLQGRRNKREKQGEDRCVETEEISMLHVVRHNYRMESTITKHDKEHRTGYLNISSPPNKWKPCTIQLKMESPLIKVGTCMFFHEEKLSRAEKYIYTYIIFHICNIKVQLKYFK
jgi:hypothetical protein